MKWVASVKIGGWCMLERKTINAIIPARGGSKSIHKKNIAKLGNCHLIAYSIVAAKMCNSINRIVVSTDDEEIAKVAIKYGAEIPFMRPPELASDESSDFGFLKHFFDNIDCQEVALLRPTTPFRDPLFMEKIIDVFFTNYGNMTGLRTAELMNQPSYKQFKLKGFYFEQLFDEFNGIKDYSNLPRQNFPETYSPNGHIDIIKKETIEDGSVFGNKIWASVSKKMIDIDDSEDLKMAQIFVGSEFDKISKYIKD